MGRVFNSKLGGFAKLNSKCMACKDQFLELKTYNRFCPVSLSCKSIQVVYPTHSMQAKKPPDVYSKQWSTLILRNNVAVLSQYETG
jgi:hypothetical protein